MTSDPAIVHAMAPALQRVETLQASPLGLSLDAAIRRVDDGRSPLGNLIAEALREAVPGADVAAINNAGRLWADLPGGPITVGQIYDVFPFDNRLVRVSLTGADLSRWLANEIRQGRRSSVGISGVDMNVRCLADGVHVDLLRGTERIDDSARLIGVTIGAPTLNGNLASPDFLGGIGPVENNPVAREVDRGLVPEIRPAPARRPRSLPQSNANNPDRHSGLHRPREIDAPTPTRHSGTASLRMRNAARPVAARGKGGRESRPLAPGSRRRARVRAAGPRGRSPASRPPRRDWY